MKKIFFTLITLLVLSSAVLSVCAASTSARLVDDANVLTYAEQQEISSMLDSISEKYGVDVVIITTQSCGNKSPRDYADDFYDENGYSSDGVLLLVSLFERDWYVSTAGYGITAFTDAGIEYIADRFVPYLSDAEYFDAFSVFAESCDEFISQANAGNPYGVGNLPREPFDYAAHLVVSLAIGFIIALIVTGVMKSSLKTVRLNPEASSYITDGSLEITKSRDFFLYRNVIRTPRASSSGGSGTHRSSSGRTHGGRGGKF